MNPLRPIVPAGRGRPAPKLRACDMTAPCEKPPTTVRSSGTPNASRTPSRNAPSRASDAKKVSGSGKPTRRTTYKWAPPCCIVSAPRPAVERHEPGMTIGLGSGRAVFCAIEEIVARWPHGAPVRAVCASNETARRADAAAIEQVTLDGQVTIDVAIDGADEVDPSLNLIKGGGGALLREKLLIEAAKRFIVVAETPKRVERLGATRRLPVEVVRFAWPETRRRLLELLPDASLRAHACGEPVMTDEGHHLLDCVLPPT